MTGASHVRRAGARARGTRAAVVGTCSAALRRALIASNPSIRFASRLADPVIRRVDVVVRVFACGDVAGRRAFTRAANRMGVASLGIEAGDDCLLIGPLTLVGRAGCGACGAARMRGASASLGVDAGGVRRSASIDDRGAVALGRELRSLLRGTLQRSRLLGRVLAVDLNAATRSWHRVVPVPNCPVCGGPSTPARSARTAVRLSDTTPPWDVAGALGGLIDRRTGIIPAVVFEPVPASGLPYVATTAPPTLVGSGASLHALPIGWGKGLTVSGALLSAVGETMERYAASVPDPRRIVWARAAELDGPCLDPRSLPLYTAAQYAAPGCPFVPYDPQVRHPWVRGSWFGTTRPVWVPAVLVYLSMTLRPEQHIVQGTSNGLAAGAPFEEASLRASLELVERDALLTAWMTARGGRRVVLDASVDPRLRGIVTALEALGAAIEIYLLPDSAYGATVLCLGLGDGRRYPGVTIGLGAGTDVHAALRSAVLELGQTGPYLQRMMLARTLAVPRSPRMVQHMLDHAAYYFPAHRAAAFDRVRGVATPVNLADLPRSRPRRPLAHCAAALAAAGIRVAVVDVTSADMAAGPFRVARAVSPDLQPITYGFGRDRQPVERIRRLGVHTPAPPVQPVW